MEHKQGVMSSVHEPKSVLLATNEAFAQHCAVCIASLAHNNQADEFNIVVLGVDLSEACVQRLLMLEQRFSNIQLQVKAFPAVWLDPFPEIGVYPKDIYVRLWVEEFFHETEKVLYLDADTIVVGSMAELFATDLDGYFFAAVDIPFANSHHRCHLPEDQDYFNSGVLLFNIPAWRENRCRDTLLAFLIENEDIALNPDQDALNGCFYRQRRKLDYKYNLISSFFRAGTWKPDFDSKKQAALNDAVIVHFNGNNKPWLYTSTHPYQSKYLSYLQMTAWADDKPRDKTWVNIVKKAVRRILSLDKYENIRHYHGL